MQAEITRIVAYAYEQKSQRGNFPADLSGYVMHDAEMKPYLQGYQLNQRGEPFIVRYRVRTASTSHWYSSEGGWGYYPD